MDLVQVLPNALKCPCVSIKHALKKQGIKTLKPLISQGFQVSVSILVTQDGCEGRTRTYGLRVRRYVCRIACDVLTYTAVHFDHAAAIIHISYCAIQSTLRAFYNQSNR